MQETKTFGTEVKEQIAPLSAAAGSDVVGVWVLWCVGRRFWKKSDRENLEKDRYVAIG